MIKKNKILYIDDEIINLQLFEYNFSGSYEVITGNSGALGLKLLEKHPDIKVVISDMKMPIMNGLEFINRAKLKFKEKIYFILTGYDITEEIEMAITSRLIMKYFRKPFNISEIQKAINEAINGT